MYGKISTFNSAANMWHTLVNGFMLAPIELMKTNREHSNQPRIRPMKRRRGSTAFNNNKLTGNYRQVKNPRLSIISVFFLSWRKK